MIGEEENSQLALFLFNGSDAAQVNPLCVQLG
jgi:hypothetical protein